jgi:hypothetical protein
MTPSLFWKLFRIPNRMIDRWYSQSHHDEFLKKVLIETVAPFFTLQKEWIENNDCIDDLGQSVLLSSDRQSLYLIRVYAVVSETFNFSLLSLPFGGSLWISPWDSWRSLALDEDDFPFVALCGALGNIPRAVCKKNMLENSDTLVKTTTLAIADGFTEEYAALSHIFAVHGLEEVVRQLKRTTSGLDLSRDDLCFVVAAKTYMATGVSCWRRGWFRYVVDLRNKTGHP